MIEVLKGAWLEFLAQLKPLAIATFPWILSAVALDAAATIFSESINGFVVFLISVVEIILQAMVVFVGLQVLFKSRGEKVEVTAGKIIIYIIAASYIGIATMLGMIFFLIPGIIIMAASFFAPIYILQEGQGPIEAVASSASLLQGRIFHVTLLLCSIWLVIYAIEYAVGLVFRVFPAPVILTNTVTSSLLLLVKLVALPVMIHLKMHLVAEHNKQL